MLPKLLDALALRHTPLAILLSDDRPVDRRQEYPAEGMAGGRPKE